MRIGRCLIAALAFLFSGTAFGIDYYGYVQGCVNSQAARDMDKIGDYTNVTSVDVTPEGVLAGTLYGREALERLHSSGVATIFCLQQLFLEPPPAFHFTLRDDWPELWSRFFELNKKWFMRGRGGRYFRQKSIIGFYPIDDPDLRCNQDLPDFSRQTCVDQYFQVVSRIHADTRGAIPILISFSHIGETLFRSGITIDIITSHPDWPKISWVGTHAYGVRNPLNDPSSLPGEEYYMGLNDFIELIVLPKLVDGQKFFLVGDGFHNWCWHGQKGISLCDLNDIVYQDYQLALRHNAVMLILFTWLHLAECEAPAPTCPNPTNYLCALGSSEFDEAYRSRGCFDSPTVTQRWIGEEILSNNRLRPRPR